jgi:hypothetical protein
VAELARESSHEDAPLFSRKHEDAPVVELSGCTGVALRATSTKWRLVLFALACSHVLLAAGAASFFLFDQPESSGPHLGAAAGTFQQF